jgi:hypothetical protein
MVEACSFPLELETAVKEWAAYKMEKRQGYKETGFNNLLSQIRGKMDTYGAAAVVNVIRESMANNWQGIIWDRIKAETTQTGPDRTSSSVEQFAKKASDWANG